MKETDRYPLLAYVVPMATFMALTAAESWSKANYIWLYFAKVILVTATLLWFKPPLKDIQPKVNLLLPGILVGLAVFIEWVVLDKLIPYPHLGQRTGLNPFTAIDSSIIRSLFLVVRFYGLVIMVPVMEEIFWRSFLLRFLSDSDFTSLPIGTYSWTAFFLVAVGFSSVHTEWLVAFICACAYALLLKQTRSLFACIVAHATTNLALGIYVICTHDWVYW